MRSSYFDLVEEFEHCIWFLYAQKKGVFFTRSMKSVFFSTILFLLLSKIWLGFFYIIFLQWFWIFNIYINEIDFILNEDTNDNADFEYDDISTDKDTLHLISPRSQILWARSGLLMNKKYSLVNYMDSKILNYNEHIPFIFYNKYKLFIFSLTTITSYKPIVKVYFDLKKYINKEDFFLLFINKSKLEYLKNYNININMTNINNYLCFTDLIKYLQCKYFIKSVKHKYIFLYLNSRNTKFVFLEFNKFIEEVRKF